MTCFTFCISFYPFLLLFTSFDFSPFLLLLLLLPLHLTFILSPDSMIIVLRNPLYFITLALLGIAAYVTYTLNLWNPMIRMANAASQQALEIAKEKLRDFLENSDAGRHAHARAMAMSGASGRNEASNGSATGTNGRFDKNRGHLDDHHGEDDDDDNVQEVGGGSGGREKREEIPLQQLDGENRRRRLRQEMSSEGTRRTNDNDDDDT